MRKRSRGDGQKNKGRLRTLRKNKNFNSLIKEVSKSK